MLGKGNSRGKTEESSVAGAGCEKSRTVEVVSGRKDCDPIFFRPVPLPEWTWQKSRPLSFLFISAAQIYLPMCVVRRSTSRHITSCILESVKGKVDFYLIIKTDTSPFPSTTSAPLNRL